MPWRPPREGFSPFAGWDYDALSSTLQLIVDSMAALVGFSLVGVNVIEGDELVSTVTTHPEMKGMMRGSAATIADLQGARFPMVELLSDLAKAEDWGRFKFVPHERQMDYGGSAWVSDRDYGDAPDAWHPLNSLWAPLFNTAGQMIGILAMDDPKDGKVPPPERREELNQFAAHAENALLNALAGAQLQERVRLSHSIHRIVRTVSSETSVPAMVDAMTEPIIEAFGLSGVWVRLFGSEGGIPAVLRAGGTVDPPQDPLIALGAHVTAPDLLERGAAAVIGRTQAINFANGVLPTEYLRSYLARRGVGSMMFIPLGAGPRCIGALSLLRGREWVEWSEGEYEACIGLGLDLGAAIAATYSLEHEQRVVSELTALDQYKDELISTVSRELRMPLLSITDQLEVLRSPAAATHGAAIESMQADALHMNEMVNNLLLLARVADPSRLPGEQSVDLVPLVERACERAGANASLGQEITTTMPRRPTAVIGSTAELTRMIECLVTNAVQFMPYPGSVQVSLTPLAKELTLTVTDEGVGIPSKELGRVFEEFYRSSNVAARDLQGAGLGLAIVSRVVHRHGGHVEVSSRPHQGSTFRVFLPLAAR